MSTLSAFLPAPLPAPLPARVKASPINLFFMSIMAGQYLCARRVFFRCARTLVIISLTVTMTLAVVIEPVNGVKEGEPQRVTRVNAGKNVWKIMAIGDQATYRHWLSICLDLPAGEALRSACVAELRSLKPLPSVLVSGFHVARTELPGADDPWMLAIGAEVPIPVARSVLVAVRKIHSGPLAVRGWNNSEKIISVSPLPIDDVRLTNTAALDGLCGPLSDADFRRLVIPRLSEIETTPPAEVSDLLGNTVVDLDLRSENGKQRESTSALTTTGGTWTPSGLFLPGHRLLRFPQRYPVRILDAPIPTASYSAEVRLPDDIGRSLTVTLVLFQASNEPERDNLFSLGRRSRWLSAQTGKAEVLMVGLENRWVLFPALFPALFPTSAELQKPMTLALGQWHTVTIGVNDGRQNLRIMVDGQAAADIQRPEIKGAVIPQRIDEAGNNVLTFVDPGAPRHFHGFIQRIMVHRGLLSVAAMSDVHRSLPTKDLASPPRALLLQALTGDVVSDQDSDEPKQPKPEDLNDF